MRRELKNMPSVRVLYGNELEYYINLARELKGKSRIEFKEDVRIESEKMKQFEERRKKKLELKEIKLKKIEKMEWIKSIKHLNKTEQILILRKNGLSLKDTGLATGFSGERIRQIIAKRKRIVINQMILKLEILAPLIELAPLDWEPSV